MPQADALDDALASFAMAYAARTRQDYDLLANAKVVRKAGLRTNAVLDRSSGQPHELTGVTMQTIRMIAVISALTTAHAAPASSSPPRPRWLCCRSNVEDDFARLAPPDPRQYWRP
jgi:hypothetical protein